MALAPEQCAKELARLLSAQTEVYRAILEKTKLQQALVEERSEDKLLALLADKQNLIDRHQKLVDRTNPVRAEWEAGLRERVTPEDHARVEQAWNSLRDVLDEIVKLEDVSRAMFEEQKNKVSVDIGNLQRGKILNKAYGGAKTFRPPEPPRYSDKQG